MKRIAWIDTETTGVNPYYDEPVSIAVVLDNGNSFYSLVQPTDINKLSDGASAVNGITKEMLRKAPTGEEVADKLVMFLIANNSYVKPKYNKDRGKKYMFGGYNVGAFDIQIMKGFFDRFSRFNMWQFFSFYRVDVYDMVQVEYFNDKLGDIENLKLETVCNHYGVRLDNAHNSIADIIATKELYNKLK